MRHPIHPMLVHFPIATWVISTLCDIGALFTANELISQMAGVLLVIGVITALFAMVAGLMELPKINRENPAIKVANQHMLLMMTCWSLYAVSLFMRLDGNQLGLPNAAAVTLSVTGLITLCIGGWLGGRLVYEYGVGRHSDYSS